jgi:hypothetical protein
MKKNEIISSLKPVIEVLDELGVLYYIGGSIASSAFGIARSTLDVDVIMNLMPYHVKPFVEKLKSAFFIDEKMILDAIKTRTSFNILHLKSMLKVDVFILKDQPYEQKAFERKIKDNLDDDTDSVSVYLCSPEDIIINKMKWYKAGGEISERQWLDIQGVIKVQNDLLDKKYLVQWSKDVGVYDLLKKSFVECNLKLN